MGGHFGSRVIGAEKAEEEAIIKRSGAEHFGVRVIGEILARRKSLEAQTQEKDSRSDPVEKQRKREDRAKQRAEAKKAEKAEKEMDTVQAPTSTNLEELQSALEGNPAFYEDLYSEELKRIPRPRKAALRLFLVFEMEHEDRDERKTEIEEALSSEKE